MNGLTTGILRAETAHRVSEKDALFCLPQGNSVQQMVHMTLKYIVDHPEEEHLETDVIVLRALYQAFPCSGQPIAGI